VTPAASRSTSVLFSPCASSAFRSSSQAVVFGLGLDDHGLEAVLERVGRRTDGPRPSMPTSSPRLPTGPVKTPMVNAGAISTTSLVTGCRLPRTRRTLLEMFARLWQDVSVATRCSCPHAHHTDTASASAPMPISTWSETASRKSLELYFSSVARSRTCHDLSVFGPNPWQTDGGVIVPQAFARSSRSLVKYPAERHAVVRQCTTYAGEWAFRVGLPAKSAWPAASWPWFRPPGNRHLFFSATRCQVASVRGVQVCGRVSLDFRPARVRRVGSMNSNRLTTVCKDETSTIMQAKCPGPLLAAGHLSRRLWHSQQSSKLRVSVTTLLHLQGRHALSLLQGRVEQRSDSNLQI